MPDTTPLLVVHDLCKQFQTSAETLSVLDHVQFQMCAGENVSIVGASGSGKSTLLYILGTLDQPTSGTVTLDGVNPFSLKGKKLAAFRNSSIGFVFQDHHLLPQLSVFDNILLPALASGTVTAEITERAQRLLDAVGLQDRRSHTPAEISGGERQRTAVARALLNKPRLILADEPTGNLDAESSQRVADLLFELANSENALLVIVTHSAELAQRAGCRLRLEARKLIEY